MSYSDNSVFYIYTLIKLRKYNVYGVREIILLNTILFLKLKDKKRPLHPREAPRAKRDEASPNFHVIILICITDCSFCLPFFYQNKYDYYCKEEGINFPFLISVIFFFTFSKFFFFFFFRFSLLKNYGFFSIYCILRVNCNKLYNEFNIIC